MTTLVMIVCLLAPNGAGCVQITEATPSQDVCKARAVVIQAKLAGDPETVLIGALVRCDGPTI